MNVVMPQQPTIHLNTVHPPTDAARRDNQLRELVSQPKELIPYNRETPLGSEKDQTRHIANPLNLSQQYDLSDARFARADITERDGSGQQQQQQSPSDERDKQQQQQQQAEKQLTARIESAEREQLTQLRARDLEVKAHEQAHALVGGQYASAPTYGITRGPDGVSYAVSGEVQIDTSEVRGDPEATLQKLQTVYAAALAPSEPSTQDRQVAAEASSKIAELRNQLLQQANDDFQQVSQSDQENSQGVGYAEPLSRIAVRIFRRPSGDELNPTQLAGYAPGGARSLEISQEIRERASRIEDFYQRQVRALREPNVLGLA